MIISVWFIIVDWYFRPLSLDKDLFCKGSKKHCNSCRK